MDDFKKIEFSILFVIGFLVAYLTMPKNNEKIIDEKTIEGFNKGLFQFIEYILILGITTYIKTKYPSIESYIIWFLTFYGLMSYLSLKIKDFLLKAKQNKNWIYPLIFILFMFIFKYVFTIANYSIF